MARDKGLAQRMANRSPNSRAERTAQKVQNIRAKAEIARKGNNHVDTSGASANSDDCNAWV